MQFNEEVYDVMKEQAEAKADFCLGLGIAPSEYDQLTQIEIAAFLKVHKDRAEKAKRKG